MRPGPAEIARLRAQAGEFAELAERLEELRRTSETSDTEPMCRFIEDCRSWSRQLRSASSYLECAAWWYRWRKDLRTPITRAPIAAAHR